MLLQAVLATNSVEQNRLFHSLPGIAWSVVEMVQEI